MSSEERAIAPRTLRSIMHEWDALIAEIEENDGEITEKLEARMRSLEIEIPEKIDNCGYFLEQAELQVEYRKKRIEAEYAIRYRWEKAIEYLKNYIKGSMFERGEKKKTGNEFVFTAVEMKPKLVITDEAHLPGKYLEEKVYYEPKKDLLRDDLMSGLAVPGARLEQVTALRKTTNKKLTAPTKGETL